MNEQTLSELIDACRAGDADLQQPELQALADAVRTDPQVREQLRRSQQVDQQIRAAMHGGSSVPEGLAERLKAAVAASTTTEHRTAAEHSAAAERGVNAAEHGGAAEHSAATQARDRVGVPLESEAGADRGPRSRRWLIGGLLLAATAASLVLAVSMYPGTSEPLTLEQLADQAEQWVTDLEPETGWQPGSPPVNSAAVKTAKARWQRRWILDDRQAVVVDLSSPGRGPAYLFVVKTVRPCNVRRSPFTSLPTSQFRGVAWQTETELYVLVLDRDLRPTDFVRPTPLT